MITFESDGVLALLITDRGTVFHQVGDLTMGAGVMYGATAEDMGFNTVVINFTCGEL